MSANPEVITLRAHHLLCLQGFQGYGYTQDFADNMADILKRIDAEPEIELEIITACDDICSKCPHQVSGICQRDPGSDQEVREMDSQVLEKLDLQEGHRGKAVNLIELLNQKFRDISDIKDVCKNCDWKKKCMHFI
ncbi:MAG: DUF1284 domain-containing protein [Thermoplasmata archaeon]|nr:MAG: DUF1284 domain-containing protein [Thermoplasmata archaeon]